MLLVIDDAWSLESAQVLCIADYGCHLLTTRNKAIAKAFDERNQAAPVMPLDQPASCELLALLAPEAFSADERAARALATAVDGLLGKGVSVMRDRGRPIDSELAPTVLVTIHPSAVLRARDDRDAMFDGLVKDLRVAAKALATSAA